MNKFLLVAVMALTACSAEAGFLTNLAADATREKGEDRKPTAEYSLDTFGNDVRVYEWMPVDNPNVRCVFVAGAENATGVACYEVESKESE